MKKLKAYYSNLNLQNKLRFSYILLILIPLTLLCIVYYWVASNNIVDIAKKNILDVTSKNMKIIDSELETFQESAIQLNVDSEIFKMLRDMNHCTKSEMLQWDKKITAVLKKYYTDDYILSVNIMTPRYIFGDNTRVIIPNSKFFASDLYQEIKEKKGEIQWIPTYQVESEFQLDFPVENGTVFSLAQELNPVLIDPEAPNSVEYLKEDSNAVLVVNLNETLIQDMFRNSNSIEGAFYCVSSTEGVIVDHTDEKKNGTKEELPWLEEAKRQKEGSLTLEYQGEKVVVCYSASSVTGWIAASVTPVNSLLDNVSKIQILTILVWVMLFVMAMVAATIFSRKITYPIELLVNAMKQAGKGDFSLRLPTHGTDEMQYLTKKYNEMSDKIETLVEENYKSEIRKKESEIMALNLQLNPHFLYNSLNIINMMALEEGSVDVSKMIISLSDMLQYTFRNKQELVVFQEEYLWLQNYLHIMSARFEGKFEVRYEVDQAIYKYKIPKLLLQPLIENAIVHGFRKMDSGGILKILAKKEEAGCVHIEVEDNGSGMTQEELTKAMNGAYNRIGLTNAMRRLYLIYGEKGKLEVHTAVDKGTKIVVEFSCQ